MIEESVKSSRFKGHTQYVNIKMRGLKQLWKVIVMVDLQRSHDASGSIVASLSHIGNIDSCIQMEYLILSHVRRHIFLEMHQCSHPKRFHIHKAHPGVLRGI